MKSTRGGFYLMRKILVIVIWLSAGQAFADIIQLANSGYGGLDAWARQSIFGQSFTATSNEPQVDTVSLRWGGSYLEDLMAPAPTISAQLLSGSGLDGNVLSPTASVGPIPYSLPWNTWIDFKFPNPISLDAGQVYTLRFDVAPTGSTDGLIGMSFANPYPGGQAFLFGGIWGDPTGPDGDLTFRVLSSPEPSTLCLFALGAISLVTGNRRRPSSL